MKYVDTGTRDDQQAIGSWLSEVLDERAGAIRWASGFFGAEILGYFVEAFQRLRAQNGIVRLLVGSNDGLTTRSDVEVLLTVLGEPWAQLDVGVVKFENAYFHPKTVHISRTDGSSTAYVGSANLTASGVSGKHIEAGILLDSEDGDNVEAIGAVADAIDRWFDDRQDGLYVVEGPHDIDRLVAAGVLNAPRPVMPRPRRTRQIREGRGEFRLGPLIAMPALPDGVVVAPRPSIVVLPPGAPVLGAPAGNPQPTTSADYSKPLTRSDAQRNELGIREEVSPSRNNAIRSTPSATSDSISLAMPSGQLVPPELANHGRSRACHSM